MLIPGQGHQWPEPVPTTQGMRWDPPWTEHFSVAGPPTLRLGRFRHPDSKMHIFGIWEEAEVPGASSQKHRENLPTPTDSGPRPN